MAIPENQLKVWAQPGTVQGAKNTHAAIRKALAVHQWPDDVRYVTYPICRALTGTTRTYVARATSMSWWS